MGTSDTSRSLGASRFVISGAASMAAEFISYPFDTVKVQLQLQGEFRNPQLQQPYRGMLATFTDITRTQGFTSLFRGIAPAALRQLVLTGGTAALYQPARDLLFRFEQRKSNADNENNGSAHAPFWLKLLTGMGCAATSQAFASPIDVVKIRMQADARLRRREDFLSHYTTSGTAKTAARYRSIGDAFSTIFRQEGGLRAFSRGAGSNMQRAAITNGVWISTYDEARELLTPATGNTLLTTLLASQMSGTACLLVSSPWDVVRTRLMNQHTGYRHALDCLVHTVRDEGVLSLYKGFVPALARGSIWSASFFVLFESAMDMTR